MLSSTSTNPPSSSPASTTDMLPVLISGAGPTGLFAAILLTKLGIPCRLIERHMDISPLSKALVIHSRTMEVLEMAGHIDPFLSRGQHVKDAHVYFSGKLTSVLPGLNNEQSHFNFGLFLEQLTTTSILTEELQGLGVGVDRGWELLDTVVVEKDGKSWVETTIRRALQGTNTRQTESKVLGTVEADPEEENKEYETEVVRSQYLIATDGGKSAVRHKLNIPFPGRTLDYNLIIFDGHVDTPISKENISLVNGEDHVMGIFPLADGRIRVMLDNGVLTPEEHAALKQNELTLEKFQELASAVAGPLKFKCLDYTWLTYYRVNERLAESFSYKDRIFLAGDAAHVHSPAGGQGMNTGLQDSYNLTWKIALVLHCLAPSSILETYHSERQPVANHVINLSAKTLEMGLAQDFFRKTAKRVVATIAPYILPLLGSGPSPVSMLRIRYHENSINKKHTTKGVVDDDDHQVGQRAAEGELRVIRKEDLGRAAVEGAVVRLHELLVGPGIFHVLVFASDMLYANKVQTLKGTATTTEEELAQNIEKNLLQWRSKWSYQMAAEDSSQEFATGSAPSPVLSDSSSSMLSSASLASIPHPLKADKLFMIHVLSSDLSHKNEDATDDLLAVNKAGEGKVYLDHLGATHLKYGVPAKHGPGAIVVVRPDSHVSYQVQGTGPSAWQDVDEYFHSILLA